MDRPPRPWESARRERGVLRTEPGAEYGLRARARNENMITTHTLLKLKPNLSNCRNKGIIFRAEPLISDVAESRRTRR